MRISSLALSLVGLAFGLVACRSSNEARPDPAPQASAPAPAPIPEQGTAATATTQPGAQPSPATPSTAAAAAPSSGSSGSSGSATGTTTAEATSRLVPGASSGAAFAPGHRRDGGATGPSKGECSTDADCRAQTDYCGGCLCRAMAKGATLPKCGGPQVQCFVDPCRGKQASCKAGKCTINGDGAD